MDIIRIFVEGSGFNIYADLQISLLLLFGIAIICIILHWKLYKYCFPHSNLELTQLSLNISGTTAVFNIERNYQNLEIAHHIYIELITRKAAIPFDEEHDVIVEVYDSWYNLFGIIREEIKKISGETLYHEGGSDELISMASSILNKGLRPHLTKYQARFRKWYSEVWNESNGKSPQDIQRGYPEYNELVEDLKKVNEYLIQYKDQLEVFINDKQKS